MDRGFRRPFFLVERLTDEILEAETAVFTKIVRTMSHEVNNTLGGVVSVLETLAALHSDDDGISAAIGSCCDSCLNRRLRQRLLRCRQTARSRTRDGQPQ